MGTIRTRERLRALRDTGSAGELAHAALDDVEPRVVRERVVPPLVPAPVAVAVRVVGVGGVLLLHGLDHGLLVEAVVGVAVGGGSVRTKHAVGLGPRESEGFTGGRSPPRLPAFAA